ncbi:MAG: nitroreductase family protein [Dehalococcoidales bacterium]
MESIMEIIKKRRSVRAYKDKPLPKSIVADIMDAARYAPSARNLMPLEYKVITNKTLIKKLSDGISEAIKGGGYSLKMPPNARLNYFYSAPLLIIITAPKENTFAVSDAALAAQNIMLYATSINLGSCFIGLARLIQRSETLMKELHIADDKNIVAAVICGYPDGWPEEKEKNQKAEFFE